MTLQILKRSKMYIVDTLDQKQPWTIPLRRRLEGVPTAIYALRVFGILYGVPFGGQQHGHFLQSNNFSRIHLRLEVTEFLSPDRSWVIRNIDHASGCGQ